MAGPSVKVTFSTRAGTSSVIGADTGRYFVVGKFERGRTDSAVLVRSFLEFLQRFGDRTTYSSAWDSVKLYFDEGGAEAYIGRVVGGAATLGTLTVKDRTTPTAVDTLRVDALGAGAWSTGATIEIQDGTVSGTVKAIVRYGEDIEEFDNASTSADLANRLNSSKYVRGTDLGGGLPAVTAATALSAGNDDRNAITTQNILDGLNLFPASLGTGMVAIPGYAAGITGASIKAHCKATRRVGILAPAVGETTANLKALAKSLVDSDGKYVMLAAPWVRVSIAPGVTVLVSPEGFVAGARCRAHTRGGPWAAAAGMNSAANSIVDVEREIRQDEFDSLSDALLSLIVTRQSRVVLYGYRSLSSDQASYRLISSQDTMNWLAQRCEDALQMFVFAPIDGNGGLLGQVDGVLRGILEEVRTKGGAYAKFVDGEMIDPGYSVDVGNSVNTIESLGDNVLKAQVAIRLSANAERIELGLIRVALTASV